MKPAVHKSTTYQLGQRPGFTLVELLVVVAIIALMGLLLLPALARTRVDSRSVRCINNHRELIRAWRMWSDDNGEKLLEAGFDPMNSPAWVTGFLDFNPNNRSNWDPSANIMTSPMFPYCGANVSIWKCPADISYVVVSGIVTARVRSFSMNIYLGPRSGSLFDSYRSYLKMTDIVDPSPARLFVLVDERAESIDSGGFWVSMDGYPYNPAAFRFVDVPAGRHDGGGTISYADGRAEVHRWADARTVPPDSLVPFSGYSTPNNQDIAWLQDRTTRLK
jgi:prepilin-type N-terminal cleavage/methylation domain-containing protein/prepilin-type processing-associated H-X9-DG protein